MSSTDTQKLIEDYNNNYSNAISSFDILINSDRADTIYKDSIPYKCIADYGKNKKSISETKYSTIEIKTKHTDNFHVGDIIQYESKVSKELAYYILVNVKETVDGYDISTIQKCNNTLKFYNKNNVLSTNEPFEIPCIISDGTISDDKNNYMTLPDNQIIVRCTNNTDTEYLYQGQRFILGKKVYKIVSEPQDLVEVGLLKIKMEWTEKDSRDDFVTGIAWNEGVIFHNYSIKILNTEPLYLNLGQRPTISVEVKDNELIIPSPSLLYEVSDDTILTITNGEITPLKIGVCTITVKLSEDISVYDTIEVHVEVIAQNNYVVEFINGLPTYIYKNKSSEFSCMFRNNGEVISKQSQYYITADDGISPTSLATITSQNAVSNTCLITAGNTSGYIKLWVKSSDDIIVCANPLRIQIKSLI